MNIYDTVKEQVSALDAVRQYGIEINRAGFLRCPFHNDHKPSCKVYSGRSRDQHSGFYCFTCHKGGSVIDLIAGHYGMEPADAVNMLARDFQIPVDTEYRPDPEEVRRKKEKKRLEEVVEDRFWKAVRIVCDYLRCLEWLIENCGPETPADLERVDPDYLTAINDIEPVKDLADRLVFGSYADRAEIVIREWGRINSYERGIKKLISGSGEGAGSTACG